MLPQTHSFEELWLDRKMDIDRLHAVIEGRYKWVRGAGNTFGVFIRMIHEVLQGDHGNHYLYIGQTDIATELYAIRPMYNVLTQEGFTVKPRRQRQQLHIENTDMTFTFAHPYRGFERRFYGYMFSRIFVDLTPDTEWDYERELFEINLRNQEYRYG